MNEAINQSTAQGGAEQSEHIAKEWYDQHDKPYGVRGNIWSRLWGRYRNLTGDYRKATGVKREIRRLQREWLGDVSDKNVLELGCSDGTVVTLELAKNAKSFTGVDLSDPAIEELQRKLASEGCERARAISADFMTLEFEEQIDVVYTNSVIHHFQDREALFQVLCERMSDDGAIVCLEPMDTAWLPWLAHEVSRPFVEDAKFNFRFIVERSRRSRSILKSNKYKASWGFRSGACRWRILVLFSR